LRAGHPAAARPTCWPSLLPEGDARGRELSSPVRPILGADLPLIDDAVTVEQLLAHTSGIGDYLDESDDWDASDYVLPVPVHTLATTSGFLPLLDGHPQAFPQATDRGWAPRSTPPV